MPSPSFFHRITTRYDPSYAVEANYIQTQAERRVICIVRLGPIVFFSTATGDAWMLDANDGEASCLARDGAATPVTIHETTKKFGIEWQGRYQLEGASFTCLANDGGAQTFHGYPVGEIRRLIEEHPLEKPLTTFDNSAEHERLQRTGRNDPCPCGSEKKYKKCCLPKDELAVRNPAGGHSRPATRRVELDSVQPKSAEVEDDGCDETFDPEYDEEDDAIDIEPAADTAAATGAGGAEPATDEPDEPGLTPEVEEAVERLWDEFDCIEHPTTEQMNAHLERLFTLPPEATMWNDLFHQFIELKHADPVGVFRRIAAGVQPTPGASLGYFYWAAIEAFVRRGQYELVPEVVAGFCTLDENTYDPEAFDQVMAWTMAAGCDAEALALAERFVSILGDGEDSKPFFDLAECQILFGLRVGGRLRKPAAAGADPAAVGNELRRDIENVIHADHARRAAEVICGKAPALVVSRREFGLPIAEIRENSPEWAASLRRLEVLMHVAREAWEEGRRPPGIAFRGLQSLVAAVYRDIDDRPSKLKRSPLNLLDCLEPSGIEQRVVRHMRSTMGLDVPEAQLLLEAHSDLLRFAVRHHLIEGYFAAKSEKNIAMLKAQLGFSG